MMTVSEPRTIRNGMQFTELMSYVAFFPLGRHFGRFLHASYPQQAGQQLCGACKRNALKSRIEKGRTKGSAMMEPFAIACCPLTVVLGGS